MAGTPPPRPTKLNSNQKMLGFGGVVLTIGALAYYWRESYKTQIQHPQQGLTGNEMSSALARHGIGRDEVKSKNQASAAGARDTDREGGKFSNTVASQGSMAQKTAPEKSDR